MNPDLLRALLADPCVGQGKLTPTLGIQSDMTLVVTANTVVDFDVKTFYGQGFRMCYSSGAPSPDLSFNFWVIPKQYTLPAVFTLSLSPYPGFPSNTPLSDGKIGYSMLAYLPSSGVVMQRDALAAAAQFANAIVRPTQISGGATDLSGTMFAAVLVGPFDPQYAGPSDFLNAAPEGMYATSTLREEGMVALSHGPNEPTLKLITTNTTESGPNFTIRTGGTFSTDSKVAAAIWEQLVFWTGGVAPYIGTMPTNFLGAFTMQVRLSFELSATLAGMYRTLLTVRQWVGGVSREGVETYSFQNFQITNDVYVTNGTSLQVVEGTFNILSQSLSEEVPVPRPVKGFSVSISVIGLATGSASILTNPVFTGALTLEDYSLSMRSNTVWLGVEGTTSPVRYTTSQTLAVVPTPRIRSITKASLTPPKDAVEAQMIRDIVKRATGGLFMSIFSMAEYMRYVNDLMSGSDVSHLISPHHTLENYAMSEQNGVIHPAFSTSDLRQAWNLLKGAGARGISVGLQEVLKHLLKEGFQTSYYDFKTSDVTDANRGYPGSFRTSCCPHTDEEDEDYVILDNEPPADQKMAAEAVIQRIITSSPAENGPGNCPVEFKGQRVMVHLRSYLYQLYLLLSTGGMESGLDAALAATIRTFPGPSKVETFEEVLQMRVTIDEEMVFARHEPLDALAHFYWAKAAQTRPRGFRTSSEHKGSTCDCEPPPSDTAPAPKGNGTNVLLYYGYKQIAPQKGFRTAYRRMQRARQAPRKEILPEAPPSQVIGICTSFDDPVSFEDTQKVADPDASVSKGGFRTSTEETKKLDVAGLFGESTDPEETKTAEGKKEPEKGAEKKSQAPSVTQNFVKRKAPIEAQSADLNAAVVTLQKRLGIDIGSRSVSSWLKRRGLVVIEGTEAKTQHYYNAQSGMVFRVSDSKSFANSTSSSMVYFPGLGAKGPSGQTVVVAGVIASVSPLPETKYDKLDLGVPELNERRPVWVKVGAYAQETLAALRTMLTDVFTKRPAFHPAFLPVYFTIVGLSSNVEEGSCIAAHYAAFAGFPVCGVTGGVRVTHERTFLTRVGDLSSKVTGVLSSHPNILFSFPSVDAYGPSDEGLLSLGAGRRVNRLCAARDFNDIAGHLARYPQLTLPPPTFIEKDQVSALASVSSALDIMGATSAALSDAPLAIQGTSVTPREWELASAELAKLSNRFTAALTAEALTEDGESVSSRAVRIDNALAAKPLPIPKATVDRQKLQEEAKVVVVSAFGDITYNVVEDGVEFKRLKKERGAAMGPVLMMSTKVDDSGNEQRYYNTFLQAPDGKKLDLNDLEKPSVEELEAVGMTNAEAYEWRTYNEQDTTPAMTLSNAFTPSLVNSAMNAKLSKLAKGVLWAFISRNQNKLKQSRVFVQFLFIPTATVTGDAAPTNKERKNKEQVVRQKANAARLQSLSNFF